MAMCTVNGVSFEARTGLETWGQLLDSLEQDDGPARSVVTAVRFDGVDEPSFRDARVLARTLGAGRDIEVETCSAGELVASTIETARQHLGPLAEAARQIADRFRNRDLVNANHGLAELALALKTLGDMTAALRDEVSASRSPGEAAHGTDFDTDLGLAIEALVEASASKDWMLVADMLEHEIPPLLKRWNEILERIATLRTAA